MILLKIFYFLKGYVIIDIIDGEGAKLINLAAENGIHIWNVNATSAYVSKPDKDRLLHLAKRNAIAVEVKKEISFYDRYLKNCGWFLIFGLLFTTMFFVLASGYVWKIEINGCEDDIAAQVKEVLEEQGLRVGVHKFTLPDGNTLKDSVIYNIDGVNWAWVYLDGTLARVEVSTGVPAPEIDNDNTPCNISAACDGIITYLSVKNGRAVLNRGDKVSAGDIIISGAMPGGTLFPPYSVIAKGEVFAETIHTDSCIVPLYKTYTNDTGNSYTIYSLRLFSIELPLVSKSRIPFNEYRIQESVTPFGICKYKYIETESYTEQIPSELAEAEARERMYERIMKKLAHGSQKIEERLISEAVTTDKIKVTLTMTFRENIGVKTPVELWQTEELKNDETN